MPLSSGRRLGPYEILSRLGAGGMGEVYKARDTRLDRQVAIKILPDSLAVDPQFRERFDREARAISQLDHPHICALYDVGQQDGTAYLVMQYLEGETLAARLARGAMPLDLALPVAIQIADALTKAHRAGIVHRDLKPGNIMLTKTGARLLDFGLAKSALSAPDGASMLPTTPGTLTAQGTILGTFQYMAPEQIEGAEADARSDIWAFGCVLYEMLTGTRAFSGKSHASLIASILQAEPPPIGQHQPLVSPGLDHIVRRCLEKDPEARWQSIADVGRELRWAATTTEGAVSSPPVPTRVIAIHWIIATALMLPAGMTLARLLRGPAVAPAAAPMNLTLSPPDGLTFTPFGSSGVPHFDLSPDGRQITFVASAAGRAPSLWVRPLDSRVARELPGSEDAASPFWSPDGQAIGFFAQGFLKTISLRGERPSILTRVTDPAGGTWSNDVILIGHGTGPVTRIAASGGAVTEATSRGPASARPHRRPQFLPDGRRFIYTEGNGAVFLATLDSASASQVLDTRGTGVYVSPGFLLFVPVQTTTLMAQAVDESLKPTGASRQILDRVFYAGGSGYPPVSASANGVLGYWDGTTVSTEYGWFDRQGNPIPAMVAPRDARTARISPDDRQVAYGGSGSNVWIMDSRGQPARFTFNSGGASGPVWSWDGRDILFTSFSEGLTTVLRRRTSGLEKERLIAKLPGTSGIALGNYRVQDWSRDGRSALVNLSGSTTGRDIVMVSVDAGQVTPLLLTPAFEIQARFSPDGRWIAYASDETGRFEVFVEPLPQSGNKWQISTAGGSQPVWRRDGKELFFLAPDSKLMSVAVAPGETFGRVTPQVLFQTRMRPTYPPYPVDYDVTSDGKRFLINSARPDTGPTITIVTNWTDALLREQK